MKTVLITLLAVCGIGFVLCAGLGVAGYFWLRDSLAKIHVTDPVQVREVTAEITEIELPRELLPQNAVSFLGTRIVEYHWCPSGTCDDENASEFTLVSIPNSKDDKGGHFDIETTSDDAIEERFIHYAKTVHEFEIRGKKYPFTFVCGEARPDDANADDNVDEIEVIPVEPAVTAADSRKPVSESSEPPDPVTSTTESAGASLPAMEDKKSWWIFGDFPGKNGRCKLDLQLKSDEYDEAKILAMLRSIR